MVTSLFSRQAHVYREARPTYPGALFRRLAELSPGRDLAWDCGAGSGQASHGLRQHFATVVATDLSQPQLRHLPERPGVFPVQATAHRAPLQDHAVDLVTVAQALHWFPLEAFYHEVSRVLRSGGLLAVWSYGRIRISPEVDELVAELHDTRLGPWWDAARIHVENGYRALTFPYPELPLVGFPDRLEADWTRSRMLAYLESWSALQTCRRKTGGDPLWEIGPRLREAWGEDVRRVCWPLTIRVGRRC